jgi:hypothetical protein
MLSRCPVAKSFKENPLLKSIIRKKQDTEFFVVKSLIFTQCKNCNIETRSRDYATVDEVVFSP